MHAIERVRVGRPEMLRRSYDSVREAHGTQELKRVDHALAVYLKEVEVSPPSAHQKPRLFYFRGLPPGPYHDPFLQPWAGTLASAHETMRDEASRVLAEDGHFENFIRFREGVPVNAYPGGEEPAWEAFFSTGMANVMTNTTRAARPPARCWRRSALRPASEHHERS